MVNRRMLETLDNLVEQGFIHAGQRQDVLNRGLDQARHLLLDRQAEIRHDGEKRVNFMGSHNFPGSLAFVSSVRTAPLKWCQERFLYRWMAEIEHVLEHFGSAQLDYRFVTDSFRGPLPTCLIIALGGDIELTLAMAKVPGHRPN